jgi:histidine triad (HIT) family protein
MPTSAPDCPFCEIVQREDPDVREVYRDEHVVAFFPTEPATLGHTLVIPREHIPDVWALREDLAAELARVVLRLSAAVKRAVNPQGLNVIQSNGEAASQTVFHLHVHLVPRWKGDAIGRIWPVDAHYGEDQKDEAWERLRTECRATAGRD